MAGGSLRTRVLRDGALSHSVIFRIGTRQTSETFDSLPAARAFMRDLDRHGAETARRILDTRREYTGVQSRTVVEQMHAHIGALSSVTIGTRRRYEFIARTVGGHRLGSLPLDVVHATDIATWIRDLAADGYSGKTISVRRQLLSAALMRAVDDELMVRNPAHSVKVPRSERREQTYLTSSEFERLMAHIPPRDQALILTLAGTGLRIGEVTALQVRDLHLTDAPPTLSVVRGWVFTAGPDRMTGAPKTERGRRTISLPPQVVEVLWPLVGRRRADEWVFAQDDGSPLHRPGVTSRWNRAVKAADLGKRPRVHDLRHTHVSWLIAAGVPLTTVQHRLGHASIKVTSDVYGHLMPEAQVQSARAVALALGASPLPLIEAIR